MVLRQMIRLMTRTVQRSDHLALGALDPGGRQRHHVLQLGQLRIRRPSKASLGTLLESSQLRLKLVGLAGRHVHLDKYKHT